MHNMNQCFCTSARGLANRWTQLYDHRLKSTGLKVTQYSVVKKIVNRPNITVSELATDCQLDRTTLTRNLSVLEKKGWIDVIEGLDRRQKHVRLKPEKEDAFVSARRIWEQTQNELSELVNLDNMQLLDRQITEKIKGTIR